MRRTRVAAVLLLAALAACSGSSSSARAIPPEQHPFLVVEPGDYALMRARGNTPPWREVASEAIRYAHEEEFDPLAPAFEAKTRLADLCGALALAWILDPRPELRVKLVDTLARWEVYFEAVAEPGSGTQLRWQQAAMVQSILALDVLGADLGRAERDRLEAMVNRMVRQWWANRAQDGTTSTPGVTTIWALYSGDRGLFSAARALYLARLFEELTEAGVFSGGPGYAWVRHAGDRHAKVLPIDVLVRSGENPDLYADPRLRTHHEWLFGGASTPMRTNLTFGDSDPSRPVEGLLGYWVPYRAARVSAAAGRDAAWLTRDVVPRPGLVEYLLMDTGPDARPPTSRLWPDTAVLRENGGGEEALLGALWCPTSSGGHSHYDVNAVHLCAYGVNVLVNSGYCGADVGVDATFDWNWIALTAASSNTVSVDGRDHVARQGAGIVGGFVGGGLEFATADSGPALPNGTHRRSLWLVHGTPGEPGYFALIDEIDSRGSTACLELHPDSGQVTPIVPGLEYEWEIARPGSDAVRLALFLATVPGRVELRDGGLCAFDGNEHVGRALHACHSLAPRAPIVTLAVPHDLAHPAPALQVLTGGGFTGARLDHTTGATDLVLASAGDALQVLGPESFRARALHVRRDAAGVRSFFVQRGRAFDDGAPSARGFEADRDLDLLVEGLVARVSSSGAVVLFRDSDLDGTIATTDAGSVLEAGPGFLRIALAPGTFAFDLQTGLMVP